MKISEINAIKICDIIINENSFDKKLWDIVWSKDVSNDILSKENGRCYFIVVNDEIYKIGYSDQKGGIKNTISTYRSSGNSGRPSDRTYGIHVLIAEEILKGNKVEFYFTYNDDIEVEISLMDGTKVLTTTSISGKTLELENMKLYIKKVGSHPIWNFQEANIPWPKHIQDGRVNVCNGLSTTIEDLKIRIGITS